MADATKYLPLVSDLKPFSPLFRTRRTVAFAYGFMFAFIAFTIFLVFTPSSNSASPLYSTAFARHRSPFSSLFSYFFPNVSTANPACVRRKSPFSPPPALNFDSSSKPSSPVQSNASRSDTPAFRFPRTHKESSSRRSPQTKNEAKVSPFPLSAANKTANLPTKSAPVAEKSSANERKRLDGKIAVSNSTKSSSGLAGIKKANQSSSIPAAKTPSPSPLSLPRRPDRNKTANLGAKEKGAVSNLTAILKKEQRKEKKLVKAMVGCNLHDGEWVRDDSYPLYKPGSCTLIDEQFNCFLNGRPDQDFQKLRWKPKGCTLPRLDGSRMLDLLRGKRLVFVGDSLNRNMWESLVCILRNSVKDQSKVYEAAGRQYFRTDASYSFIFQDYNFTVEFFVTPFLVQEWEAVDKNGTKKETLRLDMVEQSSNDFKDADILIFNTGHWWTHEKTSTGKDYYQEGSHVYSELNVIEAFRRALTTWGRWIDANINPAKSLVFFRGYSASHFSGGQWNSGGQCDSETDPIRNETYLSEYPPKMAMLERVLKGMKTHVTYMNVTRMTDYRKDGHPSIYRKQNMSEEERRSPLQYQDCSHWCLPGVPDSWNEILYAEILVKQYQKQIQQQKRL